MPYITASIIMQLLGVVIPKLEEWQNEGQVGQKKITQWTRYLTVALALVQSTGFVFALKSGNAGLFGLSGNRLPQGVDFIPNFSAWRALLIVLTWTAGTALVMWLGELITQRGIGNGMSIIIFAAVVSRLPYQLGAVFTQGSKLQFAVIIVMAIAMIVAIVIVESGQRRIPVQFAKRVVGRRMYGGQSTYIPLKVNQSGVIPVIFASSLLQFPSIIASVTPWKGVKTFIQNNLTGTSSITWTYIALYALMIVFFAYFYTAIAFNPAQQADIIRKQGGFIPGIRPGPPDGAVSRQGAEPHHAARLAVPHGHRAGAVPRPEALAHHAVPVRGDVVAHHRGCRARDDEADRQPADDAQLRGLPEVLNPMQPRPRLVLLGKQGAGKGTQAVRISEHYDVAHFSTGDLFRELRASRPSSG